MAVPPPDSGASVAGQAPAGSPSATSELQDVKSCDLLTDSEAAKLAPALDDRYEPEEGHQFCIRSRGYKHELGELSVTVSIETYGMDQVNERQTEGASEVNRFTIAGRDAVEIKTDDRQVYCSIHLDVSASTTVMVQTSSYTESNFNEICPIANKAAKIVAARLGSK